MFEKKSEATVERISVCNTIEKLTSKIVVVVLLFYVHGKHLRSCRDGQLT